MMDMSVYDFHIMQNLAYDAILGQDFLQMNLHRPHNNNITFKRSKDNKEAQKRKSSLPVLGSFFSLTTSIEG